MALFVSEAVVARLVQAEFPDRLSVGDASTAAAVEHTDTVADFELRSRVDLLDDRDGAAGIEVDFDFQALARCRGLSDVGAGNAASGCPGNCRGASSGSAANLIAQQSAGNRSKNCSTGSAFSAAFESDVADRRDCAPIDCLCLACFTAAICVAC